ncbi:MAG: hypothetical protein R2712_18235 [Vicinamibacterales bacterium]
MVEPSDLGLPACSASSNLLVGIGVLAALFALLFKFLPDVELRWADVGAGALF